MLGFAKLTHILIREWISTNPLPPPRNSMLREAGRLGSYAPLRRHNQGFRRRCNAEYYRATPGKCVRQLFPIPPDWSAAGERCTHRGSTRNQADATPLTETTFPPSAIIPHPLRGAYDPAGAKEAGDRLYRQRTGRKIRKVPTISSTPSF